MMVIICPLVIIYSLNDESPAPFAGSQVRKNYILRKEIAHVSF